MLCLLLLLLLDSFPIFPDETAWNSQVHDIRVAVDPLSVGRHTDGRRDLGCGGRSGPVAASHVCGMHRAHTETGVQREARAGEDLVEVHLRAN